MNPSVSYESRTPPQQTVRILTTRDSLLNRTIYTLKKLAPKLSEEESSCETVALIRELEEFQKQGTINSVTDETVGFKNSKVSIEGGYGTYAITSTVAQH